MLHHEWALRETGDAVLAGASMLPDLWRMAERRARLGSRHFRVAGAADASATRGLVHHLDTDRWFHDDEFFTAGEAAVVRSMQASDVCSEKMILFAHPLWELALDGALIRRIGLAETRARIGEAHRDLGGASGRALAESVGLAQLLPEHAARDRFLDKMESLWEALEDGRWLAAYTTPEGLAECIVRMRQRVGFSELATGDRRRLERAIAPIEALADQQLSARPPPPDPAR